MTNKERKERAITKQDLNNLKDNLELQEQQLAYNSQPLWATLAFAIAVFGGALGCVLLLFKKSLATLTLIISLAAVLAQQYYNFMIINSINLFGISAIFMPIAVTIIAIALVYLSFHLKQQDYFK